MNVANLVLEKFKNKVCCSCHRPIGYVDMENSLYMPVEGGKIIHWNCDDAIPGDVFTYRLVNEHDIVLATSDKKDKDRLSIPNCQAIERGYDLDELAEDYYDSLTDTLLFVDEDLKYSKADFKEGFQKALELMGDKKFRESDIKAAIRRGYVERQVHEGVEVYFETYEEFINSILPNKWEVELRCHVDDQGNNLPDADSFSHGHIFTNTGIPKLDENGFHVLRRKA